MYLCINIATYYLHTVYLDWQEAVSVSNLRCAWRWRRICTPRPSVHFRYPCITIHPASLMTDVLGRGDRVSWRCTLRPWSSELGDALGGLDRVNSEMHLETVMGRVWRCTGRPWSSEFGDALWGCDRARLEIQLETEIEGTQRCSGRPWLSKVGHKLGSRDRLNSEMHSELWSSEFRDALAAGYDRRRLEEYLEVVDLETADGRHARCWDSIHRLVNSKPWEWALMKSWKWRDDRQSLVYAVLGVCCTRCQLMIMSWRDREGWLNYVFLHWW